MWNWKQLRQDIATDTQHLRQLKASRREKGCNWTPLDARDLRDAKRRATIRHSIAAHLRRRLHLHQVWSEKDKAWLPLGTEDQLKLIEKVLPQYKLDDPAERFQRAMESMDLAGELRP